MIYSYDTVELLELEISSHCNAACPQCPRNIYGGKTISNLPLVNWTLEQLQGIVDVDFIKQLKVVYFCGTYGDPLMNKNLVAMSTWLRSTNPTLKIGIHTNGGVGRAETYQDLAAIVDFIAFGIDGLDDTNHLYRINTNWNAIMANVQTFIQAGGYAIWDFIVFKHNQHQVDHAKTLSQTLGFREFNIKKTGRFFNKNNVLIQQLEVLDTNGNVVNIIEPPNDERYQNTGYKIVQTINLVEYVKTTKVSCFFMKNNMVYIGADGYVFPCGFLHDRLYGIEAEQNSDYQKMWQLMDQAGGKNCANVFHTKLREIINGSWFQCIKDSWTNTNRLDRCAITCGEQINLVGQQNINIKYKN